MAAEGLPKRLNLYTVDVVGRPYTASKFADQMIAKFVLNMLMYGHKAAKEIWYADLQLLSQLKESDVVMWKEYTDDSHEPFKVT